jgi:hypothetical protein
MKKKGGFATYKRRGEWVELIFMMRAAELEFNVSKPWGDSSRYDVSVEDLNTLVADLNSILAAL